MKDILVVQDMGLEHVEVFGRLMGDAAEEAPENYSVTPEYAREFGMSERFKTAITAAIASRRGGRFVALDGSDEVLGIVSLADKIDYMLLGNMYVVPEARGFGIGALLLGVCEERALYDVKPCIKLEVGSENTVARQLYERHGFVALEPSQRTPWDIHPGVYGEVLIKNL